MRLRVKEGREEVLAEGPNQERDKGRQAEIAIHKWMEVGGDGCC